MFVIAVMSSKGGVGRTTLAANLAVILSERSLPVTLIGRASHVDAICERGLRLETQSFDETVRVNADTDAAAVAGVLQHWQAVLQGIGFLDPQAPKKLMPRLQQLFNRAALTPEEVHILRGVARQMTRRSGDKG